MADLEQIWHSSHLVFFSSSLAGELAGRLSLVNSLPIPIDKYLDSKSAHTEKQVKQ